MVSALHYMKADPNGKYRGAGLYYHRGNGRFSKYSDARDAMIKHRLRKQFAKRKYAKWRHTLDSHNIKQGRI